ncbi:MAG: hypothetical protein JWR52_1170 [Marmoricola sp.]|nr:hypothetical protein [Marmoricola sp.]
MTLSARARDRGDAEALLYLLDQAPQASAMREMLLEDLSHTAAVLPDYRTAIMTRIGEVVAGLPVTGSVLETDSKKPSEVDIVIVTVKQPEFDAAKLAFGVDLLRERDELVGGADCFRLEVPRDRDPNRMVSIVLTMNGEDSQYAMASFCGTLARVYRAKYWVLIGMAAGGKGLSLGDVVCVSRVVDHVRSVRGPDGDVKNPRDYKIEGSVARQVNHFKPERWRWHEILRAQMDDASAWSAYLSLPSRELADWAPRHKVGTSLAGDVLIEDGSLDDLAVALNVRKNYTGEMEGVGFASFVSEDKSREWLMWRGVADDGSRPRPTNWQFAASLAAATAARIMLTRHLDLDDEDLAF